MNPELYETSNAWGTAREKERAEGVGGREPEQLPEHVFAIQMAKNQPWRERLTVGWVGWFLGSLGRAGRHFFFFLWLSGGACACRRSCVHLLVRFPWMYVLTARQKLALVFFVVKLDGLSNKHMAESLVLVSSLVLFVPARSMSCPVSSCVVVAVGGSFMQPIMCVVTTACVDLLCNVAVAFIFLSPGARSRTTTCWRSSRPPA